MKPTNLATASVVIGLALAALGGIIFVGGEGTEAIERLGMFFAFLGILAPTVVGVLRADSNHQQLNGSYDERIKRLIKESNAERRSTDEA